VGSHAVSGVHRRDPVADRLALVQGKVRELGRKVDNLLQATVWRADYSPRATITTALDPERLRQATGGIVEPSAWRSAGPSR
jgi:hypothetical protein